VARCLIIQNILSHFEEVALWEVVAIQRALTVDTSGLVSGWHTTKEGKQKMGFHYEKSSWCAFDDATMSFPTGLLWKILPVFPQGVEILDRRTNHVKAIRSPEEACESLGIEVRGYQIDTVRHVLQSQRGIVKIATNGGKTEIMAMLILCYEKVCTLIIAPGLTGLTEICERFTLRGIDYRIIDSHHKEPDFDGVNICSLDSLVRIDEFEELLTRTKVLMWDECDDSSTAAQGSDLANRCHAYVRVYLSGTPFTDDKVQNMTLMGITGNVIVDISNRYLINQGYSAKPSVIFHSSHPIPISSSRGSYSVAKKTFINENRLFASRVCAEIQKVSGQGVVVIYQEKKHGRLLEDVAKEFGLRFVNIHGGSSNGDRDRAREMLTQGVIEVIFASSIWNRALDFGFPQHWFYVAGFKASNMILQRWGRALRKKNNEGNRVWIHEWFILGDQTLVKHSRHRIALARMEGFDVSFSDSFLADYDTGPQS